MERNDISMNIGKLNDLIIRMADDPELNQRYLEDPRMVLDQEGISSDFNDVLLTGSIADIQEMFAKADKPTPTIIVRGFEL